MDQWSLMLRFFFLAVTTYLILLYLDSFIFRYFYSKLLKDRTGIELNILHITWRTTFLNYFIVASGKYKTAWVRVWFSFGAILVSVLTFICSFLLVKNLFDIFTFNYSSQVPLFEPAVIGVSLPVTDFWFYVVAFFICTIVHEYGHGLASVAEDVGVETCGLSLVCFVIPLAFVELDAVNLYHETSLLNKLKIYTAGIWHNVVLAFWALLLAIFCLPLFVSTFYAYVDGVVVESILFQSLSYGSYGLKHNDLLTDLNGCPIHGQNDWVYCISLISENPQVGFCRNTSTLASFIGDDDVDCCKSRFQPNASDTRICFGSSSTNNFCILAQKFLKTRNSDVNVCYNNTDCVDFDVCLFPILESNTSTRLMRLNRSNRNFSSFLFMGLPKDLYFGVVVSDVIPQSSLPFFLTKCLEKFLHYILSVSTAIVFVNCVPSFFLDGEHITRVLLELITASRFSYATRKTICFWLNCFGSLFICLNFIFGLWILL